MLACVSMHAYMFPWWKSEDNTVVVICHSVPLSGSFSNKLDLIIFLAQLTSHQAPTNLLPRLLAVLGAMYPHSLNWLWCRRHELRLSWLSSKHSYPQSHLPRPLAITYNGSSQKKQDKIELTFSWKLIDLIIICCLFPYPIFIWVI